MTPTGRHTSYDDSERNKTSYDPSHGAQDIGNTYQTESSAVALPM